MVDNRFQNPMNKYGAIFIIAVLVLVIGTMSLSLFLSSHTAIYSLENNLGYFTPLIFAVIVFIIIAIVKIFFEHKYKKGKMPEQKLYAQDKISFQKRFLHVVVPAQEDTQKKFKKSKVQQEIKKAHILFLALILGIGILALLPVKTKMLLSNFNFGYLAAAIVIPLAFYLGKRMFRAVNYDVNKDIKSSIDPILKQLNSCEPQTNLTTDFSITSKFASNFFIDANIINSSFVMSGLYHDKKVLYNYTASFTTKSSRIFSVSIPSTVANVGECYMELKNMKNFPDFNIQEREEYKNKPTTFQDRFITQGITIGNVPHYLQQKLFSYNRGVHISLKQNKLYYKNNYVGSLAAPHDVYSVVLLLDILTDLAKNLENFSSSQPTIFGVK